MNADVEINDYRSKTGVVVLVIFVLVALAVAAFAYLLTTREKPPNPIRVLVALRGEVEPSLDAELVDAFVDGLTDFGFDAQAPQATGSLPPGDEVLQTLRQRAREVQAAHALLLDLAVERRRDSFTSGTALYRAELGALLVPTDIERAPQSSSMVFAFERESPLQIARMVADTWVALLLPDVVDWLFASPVMEPALAGDLSVEDLATSRNMRRRREAVEARRERVADFERYCDIELDLLEVQQSLSDYEVHCVGDPCGQWTLVGLDSDGSHAFVQDISRRALFPIPWERPQWAEPPEAILSIPLEDDSTPRPLFETGNILGFAEVTRDGSRASVAAFAASANLAILTLDLDTAEWLDLTVLDPGLRAVRFIPAPNGRGVLVRLSNRSGRSRPGDTLWYLLRGGELLPHPWRGEPTWIEQPSGDLVVTGLLEDGRLGFAKPDGVLEGAAVDLPGSLQHVLGQQDGAVWLIWRDDVGDCVLGQVDIESRSVQRSAPLPTCLDWPRLLPDGRLVGTANVSASGDTPGDSEVVVVDPAIRTVTPLTAGPFDEEITYASADGRRIAFNRRLDPWPGDFDMEIFRRVVCWVDVPPRDPRAPQP